MNDSLNHAVIALDGGGTRCRLGLRAAGAVTIVETGSSNVSTDFDGSVQQILAGLREIASRTGVPLDRLTGVPAFLGLAGVTGEEMAGRLRRALPFARVRIADDRPAALRGALGARDGLIAHCGTGSFFAAQIGGAMRFAGGWGPVLGDEASAQWIGRRALSVTLDQADGRHAASDLSEKFLGDFGGTAGIVRFAGTARPPDFGALAPTVTALAAGGDALARLVMQAGADIIAAALPDLGWRSGLPVCLTGGIGPHFAPYLPQPMQDAIVPRAGEPMDGAFALAEEFAHERG